ncbi:MAG TPA: GerMN domain-containing protein [Patescibacteria group bacterium]|nr:GerMN domain-containing protein [Patescibacteria group bacterium]
MNAKATAFAAVAIIIIATAVIFGIRLFSGNEDGWICENGQWAKHGNPNSPMPTTTCEGQEAKSNSEKESNNITSPKDNPDDKKIFIRYPREGNVVAGPVEVVGKAKGVWFFEGSFPAKIIDSKGKTIGEAPATAHGEWMTTDSVPFRAIIDVPENYIGPATVVLSGDDPSGQKTPEKIEIPITLEKSGSMRTKIYLNSMYFDPESKDCERVYPVERITTKSKGVARAAIEELLRGVTEEEKEGGYFTNINSDVKLNSISVAYGVAKVDFSSELGEGVGGACRTSAIISQITQTLQQFPTVKSVVISIDGKSDAILQP